MKLRWLDEKTIPDPQWADVDGLVGFGGSLDPRYLLSAYRSGVFPWSSMPVLNWWSPDPRMIFEIGDFPPHRRLARRIRRSGWRFTVNERFQEVMQACGSTREETWITPDFIEAYTRLHRLGHAHSVEVLQGDDLVGGIYGVSIGAFFGGESMFHRAPDASKAAVWFLIRRLKERGFQLLDAQVPTPHLESIGGVAISRREYLGRLRAAVEAKANLA